MTRRVQRGANRRRPITTTTTTVADVYPRAKGLGERGTPVLSFVAQYHFHDSRIAVVQGSREGLGGPKVEPTAAVVVVVAYGQKSGQSLKIRIFGYLSKNGKSRIGYLNILIILMIFFDIFFCGGKVLFFLIVLVLVPGVLWWWWCHVEPTCGLDRSMCPFPQGCGRGLFSPEDTVV